MMTLCADVLERLKGKTLATAESCTGGGIGSALTAVPGASSVCLGGVICYWDRIKNQILSVDQQLLDTEGAVSEAVAKAMALGVRSLMKADVAVSVTGLAGPGGDAFGHPVGTVFIGFDSCDRTVVKEFHFEGDREAVRKHAVRAALSLILENV